MIDLSCAVATSVDTPELAVYAERLGYRRVWCYDSPALYGDVWMALARAADRTRSIGLGPAVLVPSVRHPMVNAAAIATLAALAPGRVAVAIGSGFTGRYVLGQRSMRWDDVQRYVEVLRALLRGEEAEWDGAVLRMLHPAGLVAGRPVDVPVLLGADGPRGLAVAQRVADGVIWGGVPSDPVPALAWRALLQFGTILEPGEDVTSPRVRAAAGHGAAVLYHATFEHRGPEAVRALPGGAAWLEVVESVPAARRHLAIHEGHLVGLNPADEAAAAADAGAAGLVEKVTLTGTPSAVRARVERLEQRGVTELVYQPAGPDVRRELRVMAQALGVAPEPAG
jgi:5,10-methylenetetrahydromethanopterin reductase